MADCHECDENIEIWKFRQLLEALECERWKGTDLISLFVHPRDRISRVAKMLRDEYKIASNMKARDNRRSVQGAIASARQMLKHHNEVPPNGLVLYTGTIVTADGKKKVMVDIVPFKPINVSLYLRADKFHTEELYELLESDEKFGFIIMDGNGTLFGTRSGRNREVLRKFTIDPLKEHGSRRMEQRRKTADLSTQFFIDPNTSQPNVAGLILAGTDAVKTEVRQLDMFDPRLQAIILKVVVVYSGEEGGFYQAGELSLGIRSINFAQEKRVIGKYLEEISRDIGKCVFGVDDTLRALEMSAVETLILWEDLAMNRYTLKNSISGEIIVKHLKKDQEADQSNFRDSSSNAELEVQERISMLGWFINEYRRFGCTLNFVSSKSPEGLLFCGGFGGVGGILR